MDIQKFLGDAKQLLQNPKLVFLIAIAAGLLVFIPVELLRRLGLATSQDTWRPWAGGALIVSAAGLFVHFAAWLVRLLKERLARSKRVMRLQNLGSDEKELLREYFVQDTHSQSINIQSDRPSASFLRHPCLLPPPRSRHYEQSRQPRNPRRLRHRGRRLEAPERAPRAP